MGTLQVCTQLIAILLILDQHELVTGQWGFGNTANYGFGGVGSYGNSFRQGGRADDGEVGNGYRGFSGLFGDGGRHGRSSGRHNGFQLNFGGPRGRGLNFGNSFGGGHERHGEGHPGQNRVENSGRDFYPSKLEPDRRQVDNGLGLPATIVNWKPNNGGINSDMGYESHLSDLGNSGEASKNNLHSKKKLIEYEVEETGDDGRIHKQHIKKWVTPGKEDDPIQFDGTSGVRSERWTKLIHHKHGKKYIHKRKIIEHDIFSPTKSGKNPHKKHITRYIDYPDEVYDDKKHKKRRVKKIKKIKVPGKKELQEVVVYVDEDEPEAEDIPKTKNTIIPENSERETQQKLVEYPTEEKGNNMPYRKEDTLSQPKHKKNRRKIRKVKRVLLPGKKIPQDIVQYVYVDEPEETTTKKPHAFTPKTSQVKQKPRRLKKYRKVYLPGKKQPQNIVEYIDEPFEIKRKAKNPDRHPIKRPRRRVKRYRKVLLPGHKQPQTIVEYVDLPEEVAQQHTTRIPKRKIKKYRKVYLPGKKIPQIIVEYVDQPTTKKPRRVKKYKKVIIPGKKPQYIVEYIDEPDIELPIQDQKGNSLPNKQITKQPDIIPLTTPSPKYNQRNDVSRELKKPEKPRYEETEFLEPEEPNSKRHPGGNRIKHPEGGKYPKHPGQKHPQEWEPEYTDNDPNGKQPRPEQYWPKNPKGEKHPTHPGGETPNGEEPEYEEFKEEPNGKPLQPGRNGPKHPKGAKHPKPHSGKHPHGLEPEYIVEDRNYKPEHPRKHWPKHSKGGKYPEHPGRNIPNGEEAEYEKPEKEPNGKPRHRGGNRPKLPKGSKHPKHPGDKHPQELEPEYIDAGPNGKPRHPGRYWPKYPKGGKHPAHPGNKTPNGEEPDNEITEEESYGKPRHMKGNRHKHPKGGKHPKHPGQKHPQEWEPEYIDNGKIGKPRHPGRYWPKHPKGGKHPTYPGEKTPNGEEPKYEESEDEPNGKPLHPGGNGPKHPKGAKHPRHPKGAKYPKHPKGAKYPKHPKEAKHPKHPKGAKHPKHPGQKHPQEWEPEYIDNRKIGKPRHPGRYWSKHPKNGKHPTHPGRKTPNGENPEYKEPEEEPNGKRRHPGGKRPKHPKGGKQPKQPGQKHPQGLEPEYVDERPSSDARQIGRNWLKHPKGVEHPKPAGKKITSEEKPEYEESEGEPNGKPQQPERVPPKHPRTAKHPKHPGRKRPQGWKPEYIDDGRIGKPRLRGRHWPKHPKGRKYPKFPRKRSPYEEHRFNRKLRRPFSPKFVVLYPHFVGPNGELFGPTNLFPPIWKGFPHRYRRPKNKILHPRYPYILPVVGKPKHPRNPHKKKQLLKKPRTSVEEKPDDVFDFLTNLVGIPVNSREGSTEEPEYGNNNSEPKYPSDINPKRPSKRKLKNYLRRLLDPYKKNPLKAHEPGKPEDAEPNDILEYLIQLVPKRKHSDYPENPDNDVDDVVDYIIGLVENKIMRPGKPKLLRRHTEPDDEILDVLLRLIRRNKVKPREEPEDDENEPMDYTEGPEEPPKNIKIKYVIRKRKAAPGEPSSVQYHFSWNGKPLKLDGNGKPILKGIHGLENVDPDDLIKRVPLSLGLGNLQPLGNNLPRNTFSKYGNDPNDYNDIKDYGDKSDYGGGGYDDNDYDRDYGYGENDFNDNYDQYQDALYDNVDGNGYGYDGNVSGGGYQDGRGSSDYSNDGNSDYLRNKGSYSSNY